jgi:small subunit ribosomal protein S2
VNLLGDKAFQEEAVEAASAEEGGEAAAEAAPAEEVDLEAALGGGIRKAPAGVAALADEVEAAEAGF